MEGSSAGVTKCPACSADVAAGERFCAACGGSIVEGVARASYVPPPAIVSLDGSERDARIGRARKWLMAMSILTLISGFIFFAINKDKVEEDIAKAEVQLAEIDPETRDQLMREQSGMTWEEAKAHDRGQVNLLLVVNIGLAIVFLGMFFWAKRNALAASVTALLIFITVIGVNAVAEPKSLAQGVIVKIFFIAALAKAISAAQEERRLQAHVPRATLT